MQEITYQPALLRAVRSVVADRDHPLTRVYRTLIDLATRHHAILLTDGPFGAGNALCSLAAADILGVPSDFLESHPDITLLPSDGKSIAVDDVRELIAKLGTRAAHNKRVIVWEDISRFGRVHNAPNALLKTLEEPEGNSVFFLTAPSTEHIITTILSRTIEVSCPTALFDDVCEILLQESALDKEALTHIQNISFSYPLLTAALLWEGTQKKQETTKVVETCVEIANNLLSTSPESALRAYADILALKELDTVAKKKKSHVMLLRCTNLRLLSFIVEATIEKKLQSTIIPENLENLRRVATRVVQFKRDIDHNMNTKLSALDFVFGASPV